VSGSADCRPNLPAADAEDQSIEKSKP